MCRIFNILMRKTFRYAIIEDNAFALEMLKRTVAKLRPDYELVFTGGSVASAIQLLESDIKTDLIFMDIELSDGNLFNVIDEFRTVAPIIFTTAYDEFAIQAFKLNGVDYILKPISDAELGNALDKFEMLRHMATEQSSTIAPTTQAHSRILVVCGDKYSYIDSAEVGYFLSEDNYIFAYLKNGGRRMINLKNLYELEQILPPKDFFRLSRKVITSISSVATVSKFLRGRLMVTLQTADGAYKVSVSASHRIDFLNWLGR